MADNPYDYWLEKRHEFEERNFAYGWDDDEEEEREEDADVQPE